MLEKIEKEKNSRVYLYKRINMSHATTEATWELIRRFNNFPIDLESNSGFLRVMSPCFMFYLDVDKSEN